MEGKATPETNASKKVTRVEVICMDAGALIKEQLKSRNNNDCPRVVGVCWVGTSDLDHSIQRGSSALVVGNMHI
jgi:hypothetical protein